MFLGGEVSVMEQDAKPKDVVRNLQGDPPTAAALVASDSRASRVSTTRVAFEDLVAVLLVVALSLVVFSKNIFVDNAVVFHDEYIYKISSDPQLFEAHAVDRQLAMRLPNHLFFKIYGFGSYFGSNYYVFAQLLNVVFWAVGLLLIYRVAIGSGLSARRALAFLVVAGLLPLSAYTKYFMPESMYFAMFCGSLYALVCGVRMQPGRAKDAAILASGLIVGAMYFVKPHAIPLIIANVLFLACLRGRVRYVSIFGVGAVTAVVAGRALFSVSTDGASVGLGMYAQAVGPLLSKLGDYFAQPAFLASDLAGVATGHVLYLSAVFGLAFVAAVSTLLPRLGLLEKDAWVSEGARLVSLYLIVASAVLIGMAIVFTLLAGEVGRVHSRYYFFLFPVALMALFHYPELKMSSRGRICGAVVVLACTSWLAARGQVFSQVLPISLVSDSPEWGFVFFSKTLFYVVVVGLAVSGLLAVRQPRGVYLLIVVIGVASLISDIDVGMKQKGLFRNSFVTGREALAVEQIVGKERMGQSVVVGQSWDGLSKFLFHLQTAPSATLLPEGGSLQEISDRFSAAPFIIVISDGYEVPEQFECNADVTGARICGVGR